MIESFLKYLESQDLRRIKSDTSDVLTLDEDSTNFIHVAIDAHNVNLNVLSQTEAATLVVVNSGGDAKLNITIEEGARLNMLELLCSGAKDSVTVKQMANSTLNSTILELTTSSIDYTVNLDSKGADAEVNILQLPSKEEHAKAMLRIAHNSSDCTSRSTSKCAAAGSATGEFHGLVYVAESAQRTSSQQNSRNIALSKDAKIIAEPQLEIYADDVKCTHGATVGQMNKEAILYMRQRGLSEEQAKKLQLDGFASQVINRCAIEQLHDALSEMVSDHLQNM